MILPEEDKSYGTKEEMREQIIHLLGGRVAEQLTLDDISTGASNDIQRATDIAKEMVTKYGFSEKLGPVNYSSSDEVFLGKDFSTRQNCSEETASEIDEEVKAIIEEAYAEATRILSEHEEQLHNVAQGLLLVETLDGEQFVELFDGVKTPEELDEQLKSDMEKREKQNKEESRKANERRRKEKAEAKAKAEEEERLKIEALEKAIEDEGRNARFKPRVMTYDDMSMKAKPIVKDRKAKGSEKAEADSEPREASNREKEEK